MKDAGLGRERSGTGMQSRKSLLTSQEALQSGPELKQGTQAFVPLHGLVIGCGCPSKGDNLG